MTSDLTGAVARGEIVAYYQPQIAVETGEIVAIEALSRWQHPRRGLLGADAFISFAESTGHVLEIGMHMLLLGCQRASQLYRSGRSVDVAVNVSPVQLASPEFFTDAIAMISRELPDSANLTLEVTESRRILDLRSAADGLSRLRELGVGISVDDFGAGHSSVDQLIRLPVTELKVDRSIIQNLTPDGDIALAAAMGIATDFDLRVVAEGVETSGEWTRVRRSHCDRAQGFLFGRPTPFAAISALAGPAT